MVVAQVTSSPLLDLAVPSISTAHLEFCPILVAEILWAQYFTNRCILFGCDKAAIVQVVNTQTQFLRDITLCCIVFDLTSCFPLDMFQVYLMKLLMLCHIFSFTGSKLWFQEQRHCRIRCQRTCGSLVRRVRTGGEIVLGPLNESGI